VVVVVVVVVVSCSGSSISSSQPTHYTNTPRDSAGKLTPRICHDAISP